MRTSLEDLDELALRCRDEKTRTYISEAVSSYRAGAYRSAIVATWIAVCFDVIEKLRELALAGDREAEKHVQELDAIRRTDDLTRALKFERELLQLAKEKFELISALEHVDLQRLQEDRNRCAHPSLTADDQAYMPSAELARLHLHSAVTHLLQHPPVQGKYALERLIREVESEYFPSVTEDARVFFASGPLRRPRESLIRNFVILVTKSLLTEKPDWNRRKRLAAAIKAAGILHPAPFGKVLQERLSSMFRSINDQELLQCIKFLIGIPDCWQYLEPDVKQRLENYAHDLPTSDFDEIDSLLNYPPLAAQARRRVRVATKRELMDALFFDLPAEIGDRYITLYFEARSFEEANSWAKEMQSYTADFSADHVRRLLTGVAKNDQILGSFQLGPLISTLRSREKIPLPEFEQLLEENGLEQFLLGEPEQDPPF